MHSATIGTTRHAFPDLRTLLAKATPLADLLIKRGDLNHDERNALETVVDRHLARHEGDAEKSLSAPGARPTAYRRGGPLAQLSRHWRRRWARRRHRRVH